MPKTNTKKTTSTREIRPTLLRRERAAHYLDMSAPTFDKMVREGRLPKARRIGPTMKAWSVADLDDAVAAMPYATNPA